MGEGKRWRCGKRAEWRCGQGQDKGGGAYSSSLPSTRSVYFSIGRPFSNGASQRTWIVVVFESPNRSWPRYGMAGVTGTAHVVNSPSALALTLGPSEFSATTVTVKFWPAGSPLTCALVMGLSTEVSVQDWAPPTPLEHALTT